MGDINLDSRQVIHVHLCFFLRLSGIKDLVRGKQLVSVILKLMGYCVKLKVLLD